MKSNFDFNSNGSGGDNFWQANVKLVSNAAGGGAAFFGTPLIHRIAAPQIVAFTEQYYGQWLSGPVGFLSFCLIGVLTFGVTRTVVSEMIKRYRGQNPPGPYS